MGSIGIDLGTTNSVAAVYSEGHPDIVTTSEGDRTTPSVVAVDERGERLVGHPAKRQALVNPVNTIHSIKRIIGRSFRSSSVQELLPIFPFTVTDSPRGDCRVDLLGQPHSPEEIASLILQKIRGEAERLLGTEVREAVITVPAYFDERQRTATRDAGRIAGLEVMRIVNEPTAAALAYGFGEVDHDLIAVYDLGGGTFDVSILERRAGEVKVLASAGDAFLGGDDFDRALMDWVFDQFHRQHGTRLNPRDPLVLQRLRNAVEGVKRELSFREHAHLSVPFIMGGPAGAMHLDVELSRTQFEDLVRPLVDRTLEPCKVALRDAGLRPNQVQSVLLVGGQTRSPVVQRAVEVFFRRPPLKGINPDEAIALGAAITAGMSSGEIEEMKLFDVTPLSVGVETSGGIFTPVISRNTPLPARARRRFTTTQDDQMVIRVHVLQGERKLAADNQSLGVFELPVPPRPRGEPKIMITFEIDEEGIVHVDALDESTGRRQEVQITGAAGLTEAEIERLVDEAVRRRAEDAEAKRRAEIRNQALKALHGVDRLLAEHPELFGGGDGAALLEGAQALRLAVDEVADTAELDTRLAVLLGHLGRLQLDQASPAGRGARTLH